MFLLLYYSVSRKSSYCFMPPRIQFAAVGGFIFLCFFCTKSAIETDELILSMDHGGKEVPSASHDGILSLSPFSLYSLCLTSLPHSPSKFPMFKFQELMSRSLRNLKPSGHLVTTENFTFHWHHESIMAYRFNPLAGLWTSGWRLAYWCGIGAMFAPSPRTQG